MATIIRTTEVKGHWSEPDWPATYETYYVKGEPRQRLIAEGPRHWIVDGEEVVSEKVLTRAPIQSRSGRLAAKTIQAHNEGRGRRKQSAFQYRAQGSGRGVLAPEGTVFTRSPQEVRTTVHPAGLPMAAKIRRSETAYQPAFPTK